MNQSARTFAYARQTCVVARIFAVAAAGAVVAGCVGNPFAEAQVDPSSPVAAEVTRLARANSDYPSFSEIPATPTDVRPLPMWGAAAGDLKSVKAELERATAPETWTLTGDTEAFAARAIAQVGPELPPTDPGATEAYANELRKRATPPPPPKR